MDSETHAGEDESTSVLHAALGFHLHTAGWVGTQEAAPVDLQRRFVGVCVDQQQGWSSTAAEQEVQRVVGAEGPCMEHRDPRGQLCGRG